MHSTEYSVVQYTVESKVYNSAQYRAQCITVHSTEYSVVQYTVVSTVYKSAQYRVQCTVLCSADISVNIVRYAKYMQISL